MLSSAIRIGALLLFAAITSRVVPGLADDEPNSVSRAINLWATKTFVSYFTEFTLPPSVDVASGIQFYCKNEELYIEEDGNSGVLAEMSLPKLQDAVNVWITSNLIPSETSANIRNILKKKGFRTILETILVRADGQLVYGTLGFVELTKIGNDRVATLLYSFRKFKLQTAAVVTFNIDTDACILWKAFCTTSFKVTGFSDNESRILFSYIRFETIKAFVDKSEQYLEYLDKKSLRYKSFLPETIAFALAKIEQNPDRVMTELFTEDPFVINV